MARLLGIGTPVAGCVLACAAVALALPPLTTTPKAAHPTGTAQAEAYGLVAGCHAGFDRLVIRLRLATPGYRVGYVPRVLGDSSGLPVPLLGSAKLHVVVRPARGHTAGGAGLLPARLTPLCANLRQVKVSGDFEGVLSLGLGLQRRAGFRVFRLTAPSRLVVDVAH